MGKEFFCLTGFRGGRAVAAVFLAMFLLGYNLTVAEVQQSSAQPAPPAIPDPAASGNPAGSNNIPPPQLLPGAPTEPNVGGSYCQGASGTPPSCGGTCEPTGTAAAASSFLTSDLLQDLSTAASGPMPNLENWLFTYVTAIVQSEYDQLAWLENQMTDWWNTMWYYNLQPGLQSMARQLNVELALQSLQLQENADVSAVQAADRALARHGITDLQMSPGEQVCVAATGDAGLIRATSFGRAMRHAWEVKAQMAGLNMAFDANGDPNPGATSASGSDQQRYQDWQNIFCDQQGNSVATVPCNMKTIDKNLTNADVLPVKYLFNTLTIPLGTANTNNDSANVELGIEDLINNLVGLPAMDAIPQAALTSPPGQEGYLMRRSYLARYAAVRSVPDMVAGWRMPGGSPPGSQIGQWVAELRGNADVGAGSTSPNPSYKEIMHALSVDRFNSGQYATEEMITDPTKVEQEKLQVSAFYLMQLRDYYELLERTALTLAVQVSVMDDQQSLANDTSASPAQ